MALFVTATVTFLVRHLKLYDLRMTGLIGGRRGLPAPSGRDTRGGAAAITGRETAEGGVVDEGT